MNSLNQFSHPDIDGAEAPLSRYEGKVAVVVNVASKCGLTPQYEGIEALYRSHRDRGLVVLGFPCNQFGKQEPGTEKEIKTFCQTRYDVSFPMFSKLDVNGPGRHPLYEWLTGAETKPEGSGDIKWNFAKFVVGREGQIAGRFGPEVAPDDPAFVALVDRELG